MSEKNQRKNQLKENLDKVLENLGEEVTLIAVSKTHPCSDIELMYELGQRDFGENKVQDLKQKSDELAESCPDIRWHFIGALQSNKINKLVCVKNLQAIHSIDSIELYQKILAKDWPEKLLFFLQVNTSGEKEKSGFDNMDELQATYDLEIPEGLMTLGKIRTDDFENSAHSCFSYLTKVRDKIDPALKLSMGMSSDYKIALEHGSDFVRVGSLIFGKRS